jgi:DNA-directed RNA polymerase specialized sigma24 family protein
MQTTSQCNTPFTGEGVLAGVQAYRASIGSESLSRAEEVELIAAARSGDQAARARLIEDCLRYALRRAVRLVAFYRAVRGVTLDPQDVAQEAAVRALIRLDKALAAPNPVGYLRQAVGGAMLTFCRERQNAVRVPAPSQSRGQRPVDVTSLDAPLPGYDGRVTLADVLPAGA